MKGMTLMINLLKRNKNLRLFLLIDIISSFSIGMINTGASWFVIQETKSNECLSLFMVSNVVATLLLTTLSGKIVDSISRKKVIISSLFVRSVIFGTVALFFIKFSFSFPLICLVSAVFGVGWLFYYSASRSYLQSAVLESNFGIVNSFLEITLQVGMFVSGGLTGYLLKFISFPSILLIGSLLLLLLSLSGLKLQSINTAFKNTTGKAYNVKFSDVISLLRNKRIIIVISILCMVPLFIVQIYNATMPGYILNVLRATSSDYGLSDMVYGIGGMIAGILCNNLMKKNTFKKLIICFYTTMFFSFLSIILFREKIILFICAFAIGLSNSAGRIFTNTQLMILVKNKFMGRINSLISGLTQVFNLLLTISIGYFNDKYGETFSFIIIDLIILMAIILTILNSFVEKMEN